MTEPESCTCFISPPCQRCILWAECDGCGEEFYREDEDDPAVCEDCADDEDSTDTDTDDALREDAREARQDAEREEHTR